MTTSPLTEADLAAIERGIDAGDLTHGQVHQLIAEVRRLQATLDGDPCQAATPELRRAWRRSAIRYADKAEAERDEALQYIDTIIAALQQPGLGSLMVAIRLAKEWRETKTAQDAPGAIQSP